MNQIIVFRAQTGEAFHIAHRRMKRFKLHNRRQAHGINEDLILYAIAIQPETLTGIRSRAMLSLDYDFLAQRSELDPNTTRKMPNVDRSAVRRKRAAGHILSISIYSQTVARY